MKMPGNETIGDAEFDRRWMDDLLERLALAEVRVPRRYSIYTFPHRQFPRKCFARACYYVKLHRTKGIQCVLGTAVCGGLQHGWAEIGNIVFNGVLQRFYDKGKY